MSGDNIGSSSTASDSICPCQTCPQNVRILVDASSSSKFVEFLGNHISRYQQDNPHISITVQPSIDLENELLNGNDWDASIFPSQLMGSLVDQDILWDLGPFLETSKELDWTEIFPFFRGPSSVYHSKDADGEDRAMTRAIPLDGDILSLYYRKDLFEQFNVTIPRTWEEYNQAAAFFNGRPLGPSGAPISGSCISRIDHCSNEYWTSLILASMTQSAGTFTGFFLDPSTMKPLFGPAMEETLRIMREQLQSGHDDEVIGECRQANFALGEGTCVMTYDWGDQMTSLRAFEVGVAPTPGSTKVLDRHTGKLMKCTELLCPYGEYHEDLGIVNRPTYSAFGGWMSGVNSQSSEHRKYAVADFLAYISNSQQSLPDVLPNGRSTFVQPYRYAHVESANWIQAGFEQNLSFDYSETVTQINSPNSVLDLRVSSGNQMRDTVDQNVFDYLLETSNPGMTVDQDLILRRETTKRMEDRIRDIVHNGDRVSGVKLSDSYRMSIGYTHVTEEELNNYINESFRDAAWGLSGLMCVIAFSMIIWTFRHRNNRVMQAFQPFLLVQGCFGLLLMSSSIIPIGFDDSWYDADVLNVTCMLAPWLYVVGFTLFFSSVYAKIKECIKIYRDPEKYDILLVKPKSAMRLCARLLSLNCVLLALWTGLDPLYWERQEIDGGIMLDDGTVETYGACRGGSAAVGFAATLYALNMAEILIASVQAFKCRFLVLEYNEMQWLPLSVFPFFQVWFIGGPILPLIREDATVTFVVLSMMIVVSTGVGGMAVFAPKDWYIRKFYHAYPKDNHGFPERQSSSGIMVLQHPTVESQKQIEMLSAKVEQIEGWNTELEIEIRMMKEKFKELTQSAKFQLKESLMNEAATDNDTPASQSKAHDFTVSNSNEDDLAAMEHFQRMWKMPDDDEDDDVDNGDVDNDDEENQLKSVPIPESASFNSLHSLRNESDQHPESAPVYRREKLHSQSQDDVSETSSAPEDPLLKLMEMEDEEDRGDSATDEDEKITSDQVQIQSAPVLRQSKKDNETSHTEAELQIDEELTEQELIAQIIALRMAAIDSGDRNNESSVRSSPEDPLDRLLNMGANDSFENSSQGKKETKHVLAEDQQKREQALIARIIALRLAAAEKEGETEEDSDADSHASSSPADPLERIMNMNAEERLISAVKLKQYEDPTENDEEEMDDEDAIVHKKDFRDLSSMIQENELGELERKASTLAATVKYKLANSDLADMTRESEMSIEDSDTAATGYLALATGGNTDVTNTSTIMGGLDISKISDDGDRNFISVPDSILDSPGRGRKSKGYGLSLLDTGSRDNSQHSGHLRAGQSSGTDPASKKGLSSAAAAALDTGDDHAIQFAGEPSQGESGRRGFGFYANGSKTTIGDAPYRSPSSPTKKPINLRSPGSPVQNTAYGISEWAAVGGFANVLADFSDSHSATSYTGSTYGSAYEYAESSAQDSVASFEATTRASALQTPLANELDKLVGTMDWEGVSAAAKKYESSFGDKDDAENHQASLQEKRRKKRDLEAEAEAWKDSISKSFGK